MCPIIEKKGVYGMTRLVFDLQTLSNRQLVEAVIKRHFKLVVRIELCRANKR